MLTSEQRRLTIRTMKKDPPLAWPADAELAREYTQTALDLFGVKVDEAEALAAVAGKFRVA